MVIAKQDLSSSQSGSAGTARRPRAGQQQLRQADHPGAGPTVAAKVLVDFDAAILDLKMEDMNGLEVLKIFKKMYAEMEVIILSGHETDQTVREGMESGAFEYLSKPCDFETLVDTIQEATSADK